MNGRAYDYNLGRFLSVDPFVQSPGNSQSMNPYSYIMNNPLAGTDPSGYRSICGTEGKRKCDDIIFPNSKGFVAAIELKNGATVYVNTRALKDDAVNGAIEKIDPKDIDNISIYDNRDLNWGGALQVSGGTQLSGAYSKSGVTTWEYKPGVETPRQDFSDNEQEVLEMLDDEFDNIIIQAQARFEHYLNAASNQSGEEALENLRNAEDMLDVAELVAFDLTWIYTTQRPPSKQTLAVADHSGKRIFYFKGTIGLFKKGDQKPMTELGYYHKLNPGLHAIRGLTGHELGHHINRLIKMENGDYRSPYDREKNAEDFLNRLYPEDYPK